MEGKCFNCPGLGVLEHSSRDKNGIVCVSDVFFGTIRYDKKIKKFKKVEFFLKCSKLIFNVHSQAWLL